MSDHSGTDEQPRFAEDLAPRVFSTYPEGELAGFHTQNDPDNPYQRDNIIERKGKVDVRCEHRDIVHGFYSDDDDSDFAEPCSLLVFEFQFNPNGIARRIKWAHVIITFSAIQKGKPDPVVQAIYPTGTIWVEPTSQQETLVRSADVSMGGGFAGVQFGGGLKAESTVEREISSASKVRGSIDLRGRTWGDKNSVSWTLWENPDTKAGVVSCMRAPVLLKRQDMSHFKATVTIEIAADTLTQLGSFFKTDPKDDDVWYNPSREPPSTDRLLNYDTDNLGRLNLKSISEITLFNVLKGGIKEI